MKRAEAEAAAQQAYSLSLAATVLQNSVKAAEVAYAQTSFNVNIA